MEAAYKNYDNPEEIGRALARLFGGWNVSNMAQQGRTLFAWIPKDSDAGKEITKLKDGMDRRIEQVDLSGEEVTTLQDEEGLFEPLKIRLRGGSDYCATTLCALEGVYKPTASYLSARQFVFASVRDAVSEARFARQKPPAGSIGHNAAALDPGDLWKVGNRDTYVRAIRLAQRIQDSTDPSWRDPRSRHATENQYAECIRQLVYYAP